MRTKPSDTPFCGVRKFVIEGAKPVLDEANLIHLYNFITRRYKIHLRKDIKHLSPPWTSDEILQNFRFTNVRREHDRETKWLIDNITSNPMLSLKQKFLNIILFRLYNKHQTSELLSMPLRFDSKWDPEWYRPLFEAEKMLHPDTVFFTGAFITGGLKRALKWYLPVDDPKNSMEMRMLWFMKELVKDNTASKLREADSQKEVFDILCGYSGIGDFLAYQMFVDMTYIKEFPFSENEFTVAGPGCVNGLKMLFTKTDGMTWEECLFWLRDNLAEEFKKAGLNWDKDRVFKDLPEWDRGFNVMSLENCFCELSKYIRATNGTGRPRKRYKP